MGLLVRRLKLHLLPPLQHSPLFAYHLTITPFSRLLSSTTASPQPPHPNPQSFTFSADYLIHSCGLSSDEAVRAYPKIQHLKSSVKPDAVLHFLREVGITETHIRNAVLREPRILRSSVDKNLRPNVAKLQEVGLSIHDISFIISRTPTLLLFNFAAKIDFWLGILGSADILSVTLKRHGVLLNMNLEKTIQPNLRFLEDHCGLLSSQIVRLIRSCPRLLTFNIGTLKMKAQMAEELGIARSSGTFLYALIVISQLSQQNMDARLNNLKSLGFSQEEVSLIVSKVPTLLKLQEKLVSSKMDFLLKDAGCDKNDILLNPGMLTYTLDKRLIPRNFVRKFLMSKGLPVGNRKFSSFVRGSEKWFLETYVQPYEHAVPGLHQAYVDACAGKIREIELLKSISS